MRHRNLVWPIAGGVWLTGALWLVFHYFLARPGEFGLSANPLERWWLAAHGAFAFAALWLLGFLSIAHIGARWRLGRQRASGVVLLCTYSWLVLSGYLLYYSADDRLRTLASLAHWTVGLAALLAFLAHRWIRARKARV